jgi:hypothetical protein
MFNHLDNYLLGLRDTDLVDVKYGLGFGIFRR